MRAISSVFAVVLAFACLAMLQFALPADIRELPDGQAVPTRRHILHLAGLSRVWSRYPLLILVGLNALTLTILYGIAEFLIFSVYSESYPDEQELTRFLGSVFALLQACEFLLLATLSRVLLERTSPLVRNLVFPLASLVCLVYLAFSNKLGAAVAKFPVRCRKIRRCCDGDGIALHETEIFTIFFGNFQAHDVPGLGGMFDVVRLGRDDVRDDIQPQAFFVKLHGRCPIIAFDGAMGEGLGNIASAGKLFFGERDFPRIRDVIGQACFVAIFVGFDLPIVAAGLHKKARVRTRALAPHHDFFQAQFGFIR